MTQEPKELEVSKENKLPVLEETFKKNVDSMIENREYFREKLEGIMKEKEDYFVILGKKSLAKGGAEKLAAGFKLTARFEIDKETQEIFKSISGLIAYRCKLYNSNGEFKGEGGGADTLVRNQNDPNKTIKMAHKRAYVDAVIRTTGLSDIFTQDLEDMQQSSTHTTLPPKTQQNANLGAKKWVTDPNKLASDSQKYKIRKMLEDLGLSTDYVEKTSAGKIDTMKIGIASQVIEQLQKKIDKLGENTIKDAEIVEPCEECGEPLSENELKYLKSIKSKGYPVKFKCKKCVEKAEK